MNIKYVMVVAFDPQSDETVLIEKAKGPAHLIGKLTFPGGKIDPEDESPLHAAQREIHEEAGVKAELKQFLQIGKTGNEDFELNIFLCAADLTDAGPQEGELEKAFKVKMIDMLDDLEKNPGKYVADMTEITGRFIGSSVVEEFLDNLPAKSSHSVWP